MEKVEAAVDISTHTENICSLIKGKLYHLAELNLGCGGWGSLTCVVRVNNKLHLLPTERPDSFFFLDAKHQSMVY